jgi:proline iminopeptidase
MKNIKPKLRTFLSLKVFFLFLFTGCVMNSSEHVKEGFVKANNISLYYKIIGKGEPVVILHGGPGFDHNSVIQFQELADEFQVIFYDQRASGNSSGKADSASITLQNFVEDLEGLRSQLKLGKINLVGFSWGATLAMFYGIKYPENLKTLIIAGTGGASNEYFNEYFLNLRSRTTEDERRALREIEKLESFKNQETEIVQKYWRIIMMPFFKNKSQVNEVDLTFGKNTLKNLAGIGKFLMDDLGDYDIYNELSVIKCPVLIIHGTYDPFPAEGAYKVHKRIKSSKLVIMEDAGHFIFIDAKDRFFPLVRNFLKDNKSVETIIPGSCSEKFKSLENK